MSTSHHRQRRKSSRRTSSAIYEKIVRRERSDQRSFWLRAWGGNIVLTAIIVSVIMAIGTGLIIWYAVNE